MPRLIDANDLLMDNSWAFYDENGNRNDACIAVENAPTVDMDAITESHEKIGYDKGFRDGYAQVISEVRHGRWERVAEQPYFRKHYHTLCCSECHSEGYAKWKYCPNCGAKMDEVEDGV